MTTEEFAFWEKAFLATMQGLLGYSNTAEADEKLIAGWAKHQANAALVVWREKRASVEREHVEKVVTNDE